MSKPLEILTASDSVVLRELATDEDDRAYFEAVEASRDHLSQRDNSTARNHPDIEAVRKTRLHTERPEQIEFGIWRGDTFLGGANLTPNEEGAEIGFWLDVRQTGRGYATLAAKALAAFAARKYPKVTAQVTDGNDTSVRVLERAGFSQIAKRSPAGRLIFQYGECGEK